MSGDQPGTYRKAWGKCPLYGLVSIEALVKKLEQLTARVGSLESRSGGRARVTVQSSRIVEPGDESDESEDD